MKSKRRVKSKTKRSSKKSQNGTGGPIVIGPGQLPLLPAKDLVAFPSVMISLYVGRNQSVKAVEAAMASDKLIFIAAQIDQSVEDPTAADLYKFGVVANVVRTLKLPDGRYKVLLQGLMRASTKKITKVKDYLVATVQPVASLDNVELSAEDEVIVNRIRENLQVLVEYEHLPEEMLLVTEEIQDPGALADVILAHYKLEVAAAQAVLEELDPRKRIRATDKIITDDLNQYLLSEEIRGKTRDELSKGQKEYYLREQIKQIQRELGEADSASEDLAELRRALDKLSLPKEAKEEANKQFKRLERMPMESSEYALLRTYLEWIVDLPWSSRTKDKVDLAAAKGILDEDHFGLEKVKDRILEFLSVRKLNKDLKGPILCFVGPPGVGKTSLGRSIARALGRNFYRMSLGGMRDEAEIRGHRRTYVGALPGRIIQGIKQAGSCNPVFVLDELDKIGSDFRGDPASALLEVLDPQQNKEFVDHYLNVPFDLSDVTFVATANTVDTIPDALLDRLEVIYIPGYTTEEKVKICSKFLIPRQIKENGLTKVKVDFSESALRFLVERYTREAGVRNLEREVGALCRKVAREFAEKNVKIGAVSNEFIRKCLGPTKYDPEHDERRDVVGLVRGLAWTVFGGEVMPVEASVAPGSGVLNLTGQLGSVMQESARAALFFARANAKALGLEPDFQKNLDIHIHVPGGATPKDGPSAGITIATALVSALSKRKVSKSVAMTGEITLRGSILPIGGLKEKALAALQHGITKVIIPFDNIKDLEEIPKEQRSKLKFVPVRHISEVLEIAVLGKTEEIRGRPGQKPGRRKSTIRSEA